MISKTYYQVLNIETTADLTTIKRAFRKEITLYHPDKNPSESAKHQFDAVVEAFNVLSHPEKREAYDTLLKQREQSLPAVVEAQHEKQFEEWREESKPTSKKYRESTLTELLALDIFLELGVFGGFDVAGDLFDGIGDALDGIFDIF